VSHLLWLWWVGRATRAGGRLRASHSVWGLLIRPGGAGGGRTGPPWPRAGWGAASVAARFCGCCFCGRCFCGCCFYFCGFLLRRLLLRRGGLGGSGLLPSLALCVPSPIDSRRAFVCRFCRFFSLLGGAAAAASRKACGSSSSSSLFFFVLGGSGERPAFFAPRIRAGTRISGLGPVGGSAAAHVHGEFRCSMPGVVCSYALIAIGSIGLVAGQRQIGRIPRWGSCPDVAGSTCLGHFSRLSIVLGSSPGGDLAPRLCPVPQIEKPYLGAFEAVECPASSLGGQAEQFGDLCGSQRLLQVVRQIPAYVVRQRGLIGGELQYRDRDPPQLVSAGCQDRPGLVLDFSSCDRRSRIAPSNGSTVDDQCDVLHRIGGGFPGPVDPRPVDDRPHSRPIGRSASRACLSCRGSSLSGHSHPWLRAACGGQVRGERVEGRG